MFIICDRDLTPSEDESYQEEKCRDAEKHLKQFSKHVKCVKGKHARIIKMFGDGFTSAVKNRCSKQWHDKYLKLSKCLKDPDVADGLHQCSDKAYATAQYVLNNIDRKDLILAHCCNVPFLVECMHNATFACGNKSREFLLKTWNEPFTEVGGELCEVNYAKWCEKYPVVSSEFKRMFSTPQKKPEFGNWKLYLQIIEEHFIDNE